MANEKISVMTSGTPAQNTDQFPIVRSGQNLSLQISDLATVEGPVIFGDEVGDSITFNANSVLLVDSAGDKLQMNTSEVGGGFKLSDVAGDTFDMTGGQIEFVDVAGDQFTFGNGNMSFTDVGGDSVGLGSSNISLSPVNAILIEGPIQVGGGQTYVAADIAGQLTISAASTTKAYTFTAHYIETGAPLVIVTPITNPTVSYWVTTQGSAGAWTGFTINIASTLLSNLTFNYLVIGQS